DQEELIHLISNYSKISLYQHHLTKSLNIKAYKSMWRLFDAFGSIPPIELCDFSHVTLARSPF
ncbi:hypothetical protein WMM09_12955, partial [Enterococcus faecium]|uniref:hypothetical protein n=1 Tax=Enterococcus faecium TaxID=1352 RepID=UPI0030C9B794